MSICRLPTFYSLSQWVRRSKGRGTMADLDRLISLPVKSFVPKYKDELIEHVNERCCP